MPIKISSTMSDTWIMLKDVLDMLLGIRLYPSENHLGYNAAIRILKETKDGGRDLLGFVYLSFDHGQPKFFWMKNNLTYSQREYIELKVQIEVERAINQKLMEKYKPQWEDGVKKG